MKKNNIFLISALFVFSAVGSPSYGMDQQETHDPRVVNSSRTSTAGSDRSKDSQTITDDWEREAEELMLWKDRQDKIRGGKRLISEGGKELIRY